MNICAGKPILHTAQTLAAEIRRHIPAPRFDFVAKKIVPYVHAYSTNTDGSARHFTFFDENTFTEIVNTAIRARKANPTDLEKAQADFIALVRNIGKPNMETVYTLVDVAKASCLNGTTAYIWLHGHLENAPFEFMETDSTKLRILDKSNFIKAVAFLKEYGPKTCYNVTKAHTETVQKIEPSEVRYVTLDVVYKALASKFGMDTAQTRSCLNGIRDFVPMCKIQRGKSFEGVFPKEVADALVKAIGESYDNREFVKRAINLYDHPTTQLLYTATDLAKAVNFDLTGHDYAPLHTFIMSLKIGGHFDRDRGCLLFTEEDKNIFIEAYNSKYGKDKVTEQMPEPKTSDSVVRISINGLDLILSKQEALKVAQSIMNQIGG